jgi:hypothetical protein
LVGFKQVVFFLKQDLRDKKGFSGLGLGSVGRSVCFEQVVFCLKQHLSRIFRISWLCSQADGFAAPYFIMQDLRD